MFTIAPFSERRVPRIWYVAPMHSAWHRCDDSTIRYVAPMDVPMGTDALMLSRLKSHRRARWWGVAGGPCPLRLRTAACSCRSGREGSPTWAEVRHPPFLIRGGGRASRWTPQAFGDRAWSLKSLDRSRGPCGNTRLRPVCRPLSPKLRPGNPRHWRRRGRDRC